MRKHELDGGPAFQQHFARAVRAERRRDNRRWSHDIFRARETSRPLARSTRAPISMLMKDA